MENKFEKQKQRLCETIDDFKSDDFKSDSHFRAEYSLLELSESICEINPSQKLPIRFLLRIIEWCVNKAIYWKG